MATVIRQIANIVANNSDAQEQRQKDTAVSIVSIETRQLTTTIIDGLLTSTACIARTANMALAKPEIKIVSNVLEQIKMQNFYDIFNTD